MKVRDHHEQALLKATTCERSNRRSVGYGALRYSKTERKGRPRNRPYRKVVQTEVSSKRLRRDRWCSEPETGKEYPASYRAPDELCSYSYSEEFSNRSSEQGA